MVRSLRARINLSPTQQVKQRFVGAGFMPAGPEQNFRSAGLLPAYPGTSRYPIWRSLFSRL
jgi:hypothetical protein